MLRLTDLEVYNSIFNITKENNNFELYTGTFDEFSFEELKDELDEILKISKITDDHLRDETVGLRAIKTYWKLTSEKSSTAVYTILLMGYARSPFRDLKIVVGLDEEDIQLILKHYNTNFVTCELGPSNYAIEDLQEAVYSLSDHEETLQTEYDDLNKKTKPILTRFGSTFGTLGLVLGNDEKSCFITLLGFTAYWDCKPSNEIHADSPGVYTSDKFFLYLSTIDKIRLKSVGIDGSVVDGVRQRILFSLVIDKPSGYKVFCEPETIHYKKNSFEYCNI